MRNRAGWASLDLPHANSWFEFLLIALPQVQVPSATCLSSPGNRHPVSSEAAELEEYARKYEAIGRQSSNRRASTSTTPIIDQLRTSTTPIIDQLRKENGQASTFWPGGEGRDGRESVLTTASQVNIIRRIGQHCLITFIQRCPAGPTVQVRLWVAADQALVPLHEATMFG